MLKTRTLFETDISKLWVIEKFGPDLFDGLVDLPLVFEPPIMVRGTQCIQHRNIGFFSDSSQGYRYSGQIAPSIPLAPNPILVNTIHDVNEVLETSFNGILVNRYTNGSKYIGAHSDDESKLDQKRKTVASLAYGATRIFRVRNKHTKKVVFDYEHKPRSLLIMEGEFQREFTHEIPVQARIKNERISLTFRNHTS